MAPEDRDRIELASRCPGEGSCVNVPAHRRGDDLSGLEAPITDPATRSRPDGSSEDWKRRCDAARTPERLDARIARTGPKYRGIVAKAIHGTASPRGAIKAFCLSCVGDVRADVAQCASFACPLWAYRPYQSGDQPGDDAEQPDDEVTP